MHRRTKRSGRFRSTVFVLVLQGCFVGRPHVGRFRETRGRVGPDVLANIACGARHRSYPSPLRSPVFPSPLETGDQLQRRIVPLESSRAWPSRASRPPLRRAPAHEVRPRFHLSKPGPLRVSGRFESRANARRSPSRHPRAGFNTDRSCNSAHAYQFPIRMYRSGWPAGVGGRCAGLLPESGTSPAIRIGPVRRFAGLLSVSGTHPAIRIGRGGDERFERAESSTRAQPAPCCNDRLNPPLRMCRVGTPHLRSRSWHSPRTSPERKVTACESCSPPPLVPCRA